MEKPFFIPFGPWDKHVVTDDFTYFDVKQNLCVAKISEKICEELKKNANTENVKYLTICIAVYNEEFEEVLKTILSILNNIEFMKRKVKPSILLAFFSSLSFCRLISQTISSPRQRF